MSAEIFSLAANGRPYRQSPNFTKEQLHILRDLASEAIKGGGIRDYVFDKRFGNKALVLQSGLWEAAPDILFSKVVNRDSGTAAYLYYREGGDHFSSDDFLRAVSFAREDLKTFGAQTVKENEHNASRAAAAGRRASIHLVRN